MDEQTGNPFSVKNQLLHSQLHLKIWGRRRAGGGAHASAVWERSRRRLRPHESIGSRTCALPLISAECKQVGHSPGRRLGKRGSTTISLAVQLRANKHSGRRGRGENCSKCYMACVVVRDFPI